MRMSGERVCARERQSMIVSERESMCVCVCERLPVGERMSVCVSERGMSVYERESVCVLVRGERVCVSQRERL